MLDSAGTAVRCVHHGHRVVRRIRCLHTSSRIVSEGRGAFVLHTAATGHSMLLVDATGAYHRQMMHEVE
jgi:arsenite-transporting ATPase